TPAGRAAHQARTPPGAIGRDPTSASQEMTLSVTINAHQLGRLIDKTISHMGSEYVEPLHGIRLDVDSKYVYAVASDRYTIAVARYQLNHADQQQEPWARTIPAEYLRSLREWIQSMKGAGLITISTAKDRLIFEGPQTDL